MEGVGKWLGILLLVAVVAGCEGGGGPNNPRGISSQRVWVTLSDAPSDQVLALEFTLRRIVLTSNTGAQFDLLPSPVSLEVAHLLATAAPISTATVPQGSYSSVSVTLSDTQVIFVDPTGSINQLSFPGTAPALVINFNQSVGINAPVILNFDLNLAQSVQLVNGAITVNPVVTASLAALPSTNQQSEESGELEDVSGTVTSVSTASNSFQMQTGFMTQALTIAVNGSTVFEGISGLSALTTNTIVDVDAVTQSNGSLLATKVEAEIENSTQVAQHVEGFVTFRGANQFSLVVQESLGSGAPSLASVQTITVDSSTRFEFPSERVELSGLPFTLNFTSFSDLKVGQRVEVETTTSFASPVAVVKLDLETLGGQVTSFVQNGNQALFTLLLPADALSGQPVSAFSLLSGAASVDVFQQPSTELKGLAAIVPGNSVRVRGLLFFDAISGRYKLVATRIAAPE